MKTLLDDSRIYIEQYFYSEAGKSITYHCWFLFELLQSQLKESQDKFLNKRYAERYLSHPINILQYFQPEN